MRRVFMRKKKRIKKINLFALQVGIDKWMRNHPLYGEQYTRDENIKELFRRSKERKYR